MSEQVKYYKKKGLSGFFVYKYMLKRRADQGELCSKALVFGGGCAPKNFTAESRRKEVCGATPLYPSACDKCLGFQRLEACGCVLHADISGSEWPLVRV